MLSTSVKRDWSDRSNKHLTRKRSLRSNRKLRRNPLRSSLELSIWARRVLIRKKNHFLLIRLLTKSCSTAF